MIERILIKRQAISATVADSRTKFSVQLDFDFLDKLLVILGPFEVFTKLLSSRDASVSMVLPTFYALKHHLLTIDSVGFEELQKFKDTVLQGLEKRMESYLDKK